MRKRLLSFLLAIVMVVLAVPALTLPALATAEPEPELLAESVYTGDENSVNLTPVNPSEDLVTFYQWYESATATEPLAYKATIPEGAVLKINEHLYEVLGINAKTTYADAIAKYKAYLIEKCRVYDYPDNGWMMGAYYGDTGFEAIKYVSFFEQRNIFMSLGGVNRGTAGGSGDFGGQFCVTESFFMDRIDEYINGKDQLTAYVPADGTAVGEISITYNSAMDWDQSSNSNVAAPPFGTQPGGTYRSQSYFALRAGQTSSGGGAAYGWTSPARGLATITLDSVKKIYESSTTISWMVVRQSGSFTETVIEKTATDLTDANALAAMQSTLASTAIAVNQGDVVSLVLFRNANKCTVNMALTMTLVANPSYTTAFGPKSENYVTADTTAGTISQPENWKAGSYLVTGATTYATAKNENVVITNNFVEFYKTNTAGGPAVTTATGTWSSSATDGGGALWLPGGSQYPNVLSAGVNYPTDSNGARYIDSLLAVPAIRYIAEFTGDVTVNFSVGYYKYVDSSTKVEYPSNGTKLVIRHNGVIKQTYATDTLTGSLTVTGVKSGDTIDFISLPDLDYQATSTVTGHTYDASKYGNVDFNYQQAKRGLIIDKFSVTYSDVTILPYEAWTKDAANITLPTGETLTEMINNPNHFLFRWYTTEDAVVEATATSYGTLSYAKINPYLMSPETANILATDTYREAFAKYKKYLEKLVAVEYENNWHVVEVDANGNSYDMLYPFITQGRNPFMLSSTANQIQRFAYVGLVSSITWDSIMNSYYDATFSSSKAVGFTADTLVSQINVPYSDGLKSGTSTGYHAYNAYASAGFGELAAGSTSTASTLAGISYLRPINYTGGTVGLQWQATYDGKVTLSLDALSYHAETVYPYIAWALCKNGEPIELNTEGLTLTSMIDTLPSDAAGVDFDMCYNTTTNLYEIKLADSGVTARGSATSADAWFVDMQAMIANTEIEVSRGDQLQLTFYRSSVYDSTNASNAKGRPVEMYPQMSARMSEAETSVDAQLAINSAYKLNAYVFPLDENASAAGVEINGVKYPGVKQENGSFKVVLKDGIQVQELARYTAGVGFTGGVSATFTPYELSSYGTLTATNEKTVNTLELLNTYMNSLDKTTAKLATAIRSLAVALNAEYVDNSSLENSDPTKDLIKGAKDSKYYGIYKSAVLAMLQGYYGNELIPDDVKLYTYSGHEITATSPYYNYSATETNLWLQAYQDAVYGEKQFETLAGDNYRVWVASADGDFESATPYELPYTPYTLTDAQKASVITKWMDEEGTTLTPDVVIGDSYKYALVGGNVNLGDKISLVLVADANGANSIYDLKSHTVKVIYGGVERDVPVTEFKTTEIGSTTYMACIVEIPISMYNEAITYVIVDGEGNEVSARLQYNVLTWCARKYIYDRNYTLRAIYNLGVAADAYAKAHS